MVEECNLDTTVCEALLQVGTTSIPPSSTFAPESQTTLFQSNSTSENDSITTSSTSGEGMMNMTDMMKVEVRQILALQRRGKRIFNPFMPNECSLYYQLDEYISNLRVHGRIQRGDRGSGPPP